jgi:hypothetical protein
MWNRFDIINEYSLSPRKTEVSKGIIRYTYVDRNNTLVYLIDDLNEETKRFQFGILSDDGNEVKSLEFEDYTDREKFSSRFDDFKKFFTRGGSNEEK